MPAPNCKLQNIDPSEEIRRQCRISTGLWFELFGAIKPKVGTLLKFPDLKCNYLQALESEVVEFCLLNQRPCRIIKLKPRQKGSSTFSVVNAYRYCSNMRATGCIIGGAHAQSTNLFRMLKTFADNDRFDAKNPCRVIDRLGRWANGSIMEQLTAANPEAGRSGTYQVVIATELARWAEEGVANAADVLAGLLKCVPNEPLTLIELDSTANGAGNDFHERWQGGITFDELKAGKDGFVKLFAAWFQFDDSRRDPALEEGKEQCVPPEKVEDLRKRYGLDEEQIAWMQWAVREECAKDFDKFCEDYPFDPESAFRTSGRCRFNATNLKKMVERSHMFPPDFGNIDMLDNRAIWRPCPSDEARVIRWEQPKDNCRYLLSVDSMTGETQVGGKDPDNHAVGVLRAGLFDPNRGWIPPKLVARLVDDWGLWERNRKYELRWDIDVLEEQVWRLAQYYGNCLIVPEANMDRGLIELLKLRSANIYLRQLFNRREQTEQKAYGWQTTPSTREMIIENLARAIREQGNDAEGIDIFCPITLSELESFVTKPSGRGEAMAGRHDDCVLQTAIGLACINGATAFVQPITHTALPPDLAALESEEEAIARLGMAERW
jgi:hypothetical protein